MSKTHEFLVYDGLASPAFRRTLRVAGHRRALRISGTARATLPATVNSHRHAYAYTRTEWQI